MPNLVTVEGINETLTRINYKPDTLKFRLLELVRSYFTDQDSLNTLTSIPPDEIIGRLWQTSNPAEMKARRKNLSGLKSSINKDLKKLSDSGGNPEGIVLNRDNVFAVSEEKKNHLLQELGVTPGSLSPIRDLFASLREMVAGMSGNSESADFQQLLAELEETKKTIRMLGKLPDDQEPGENAGSSENGPGAGANAADVAESDTLPSGAINNGDATGTLAGNGDALLDLIDEEVIEEITDDEFGEIVDYEILEEEEEPLERSGFEDHPEIRESRDLEAGSFDSPEDSGKGIIEEDPVSSASTAIGEAGVEEEIEILIEDDVEFVDDAPVEEIIAESSTDSIVGEEVPADIDQEATDSVPEEKPVDHDIVTAEDEFDEDELPEEKGSASAADFDDHGHETTLQPGGRFDRGIPPGGGTDGDAVGATDADRPDVGYSGSATGATTPGGVSSNGDSAKAGEEGAGDEIEILTEDDVEFVDDEPDQDFVDEIIAEDIDVVTPTTENPGDSGLLNNTPEAVGSSDTGSENAGDEIEVLTEDDVEFIDDESADEFIDEIIENDIADTVIEKDVFADIAAETIEDETLTEDDVEFVDEESEEAVIDADFTDTVIEEELAGDDTEIIEAEGSDNELVQDELPQLEDLENIEPVEYVTEILDEDEIELVAYEDDTASDHKPTPKRRLLEVLSDYLEPEQALQETDILSEEQEEYISQILRRFTPAFVRVQKGNYQVGTPLATPSEHPARNVLLESFHIGQYPVTNDLFELFVRDTGYQTEAEKQGFGLVYEGQFSSGRDQASGRKVFTIRRGATANRVEGASWRDPSGPGHGALSGKHNHPVVQVSFKDALAFAAWAGKRLPSEEEWEAAARGTTNHPYPWGREWRDSLGNFSSSHLGGTCPVDHNGREGASPFGICDLLGNVYEWTSTIHNPAKGRSQPMYILKGGCWTSTGRITISQRLIEPNTWSNTIGFRCAV
ncbi:MAG: SUMF1/EgtB/PvdO family nonheme iron enzyme [Proteobacteria bacterium]|nr:SUMF1/EgtB/PvdO family nonheme iron enzyme [Pseudomonadota bacterium]MBU1737695.1 SUMF1/EgtB/PvdO family nonheme iron enzyme [Pseudomonadota bacterium]